MKQKQAVKGKVNNFVVNNNIVQLPDLTTKKLATTKGGARIVSAGTDNLLPFNIASIASKSSTLRAIINSKADYISYGDVVTENEKFQDKIQNNLNKYYNWYEFAKRVAKDRFTFGYAFIEEVRIGSISFAYHVDASKVRFEDYKEDEAPQNVWISDDWNDVSKNKPREVAIYPNYSAGEKGKRRIIPIMEYDPAQKDYPLPNWSGALYDAQVESLIGQYNSNTFENGITLSAILMMDFGDVVDSEDLELQKRKLESMIKGTSNGRSGKALIVPKQGGIEAPEYVTYPMQKEGSFTELQKTVENNIVKACSWFRSLAGLESAGSLGNNQQLRNEWELAEKLITNEQYTIMEAYLKTLEGTEFQGVEFSFSNQAPFSLGTFVDPDKVLSYNEKRALFGYEASEEGGERLALNYAQVGSMVEVVVAFNQGQISLNAAVQTLMIGFNLTKKQAMKFFEAEATE
jgi:hypothetical protein